MYGTPNATLMDPRLQATPIVAIVGRANVGKSTLFNRLLERRKAITSPTPGTTHDANFGHCHWRTQIITVIDTAGLDLTASDATEAGIKRQAELAMGKADTIVLVVDVTTGLLPGDRALGSYLRKSGKTVVLAANKSDNPTKRRLADAPEWRKLGFGEPMPISASNGSGVGDLLEFIVSDFEQRGLAGKPLPEIDLRVAIIGRPNVGKSSLLNSIAGEERVIVSEIPHTTKEPQDTLITWTTDAAATKHILVIDTVGIRKKARVAPGIEKIGVHMSLGELESADVNVLMIDATEGIGMQEKRLAGLIEDKYAGLVVVVNKWDTASERALGTVDEYREYVIGQLPFLVWAPIVFISAQNGRGITRVIETAVAAARERDRTIPQEELDAFIEKLKKIHHSAFVKSEKRPKVYGITQLGVKPPSFMLVVHDKDTIHPNFLRFVENRLRDEFGFAGAPMRVTAREIK